ncbi:MAG TPA: exonuclease SbcCD subunit D [Spirochaetia bacterium]|nr:exonuclease SbcCD subunit D [Spirochaetales bacterium]HRY78809.1 exonuclease SbcCD subunit D [Spirochaetia bacterium]
MKILHASDLHLGKTLHERDLVPDQAAMLDQLLAAAVEHDPAALVIAGDVYDKAVPPPEAVSLLGNFLGRVKEARPDLGVLVIPGNHDSPARLGFGDSLFRRAGVHVRTRPEDAAEPVVLERDGERLYLWALPFLGAGAFPDAPRSQSGRFRAALDLIVPRLAGDGANVLVCHAFAAGGLASESERVFLGSAELVDADAFEPFDYVALGHLHRPQKAGPKGRYPGSPLGYSFSEAGQEKGFLLVEVRRGGFEAVPVPVKPLRPLSRLEGSYADLLESGAGRAEKDHYLEILLTDPEPVVSPVESLRRVFPNLLSLRQAAFENPSLGEAEAAEAPARASASRDGAGAALEDFLAFHRAVRGADPEPPVLELFRELLSEAADAAP